MKNKSEGMFNEYRNVTEFVLGFKPNLLRIGNIQTKNFCMG